MSNYYFEFQSDKIMISEARGFHLQLPGKIICVDGFTGTWSLNRHMSLSIRSWREDNDGSVYWIKRNGSFGHIDQKLTDDELKEFCWIKLSAHNV